MVLRNSPGLVAGGKCLHNFVHPWFEFGQCKRLLQIRKWRRIPTHRLVILDAAPLGVHHDLRMRADHDLIDAL